MITRSRIAAFFGFVLLIASALAVSYSQPQAEPVPTPDPTPIPTLCVEVGTDIRVCDVLVNYGEVVIATGFIVRIVSPELTIQEAMTEQKVVISAPGEGKYMEVATSGGGFRLVPAAQLLSELCKAVEDPFNVVLFPDGTSQTPCGVK